jgi:hypothetical protein
MLGSTSLQRRWVKIVINAAIREFHIRLLDVLREARSFGMTPYFRPVFATGRLFSNGEV